MTDTCTYQLLTPTQTIDWVKDVTINEQGNVPGETLRIKENQIISTMNGDPVS